MAHLFSSEKIFYDLFEKGAEKVLEGTSMLSDLIKDFTDVPLKAKKIKDVEHEADLITHETMEKLNKTFITPIDREDIHALVSALDDILDFVEAAAARLNLFKVNDISPDAILLVDILVNAVKEVQQAIAKLRYLRGTDTILKYCIEINRLENESDFVCRNAVAKLFEPGRDPLEVIKWKEIYENIENAVDRCEDVANVLEGIALKNA